LLLDYGADQYAREPASGETALIWAAAHDHAPAVRILIEYGADVDGRSAATTVRRQGGPRGGWTPLMYAARQRSLDASAALIAKGASLNAADSDGTTPLLIAILSAHYDVAAALLERGADPNQADRTGMTPLYATLDVGSLPAPFGIPDRKPTGALDNLGLAARLLDYGADPDAPLKTPIIQRHRTLTDEVLSEGATPFMRAAKAANLAAMHLLLDYGANPSRVQKDGTTALMIAAGLGWRDGFPIKQPFLAIVDKATEADAIEAIKLCLALGADVNAANAAGDTALHGAAEARGSETIIRFLVQHGARIDARNKAGQTPLDAAFAHRDRANTLIRTGPVALLRELAGLPAIAGGPR
jgi:ankyrin repeat protein